MSAVAKLRAMLGLDSREFEAGAKRAGGHATALSSTLKRVGGVLAGAFSFAAVATWGNAVVGTLSKISDAATNLNVSTKEIGGLNIQAAAAGLSLEQLSQILTKLQSKQYDVAKGNKDAAKAFAALGISVDQVLNSDPIQLLELVALNASKSTTAVGKLGDIFGDRLSGKTLEFLKDIAQNGIKPIGDEAANAADKISVMADKWAAFKEKAKIKTAEFIAVAGGSMVDMFEAMFKPGEYDKRIKEYEKAQKDAKTKKRGGVLYDENGVAVMSEADVEKGAELQKQEARAKELQEMFKQSRRAEIEKQIEDLRKELQPESIERHSRPGVSERRDGMAEIGGLVGRELPNLQIMDRTARATERVASISEQIKQLTQEIVNLQQGEFNRP